MVGAGVVGLTTAISLAEAGLITRVVAADPPSRTTSVAAGAIWGPVLCGPPDRCREWARAVIASGDLDEPDPPVFDRLGSISVPASLLVGDADYPPLIEANRRAAARIPGCELTVVPGMDHMPTLREPDLVLRTITRTLARVSALPAVIRVLYRQWRDRN